MNFGYLSSSIKPDTTPPFELGRNRFDLSTYGGRLLHFVTIIDPRLLLVDEKRLQDAKQMIEDFKTSSVKGKAVSSDAELWEARRIIDSAVNSGTGEIIHPVARMCAFIPASLPITLGMLTMTSTASVMTLQWVNQSYNALFNYSHRSKASNDKSQVLKAYGLATATSCGLALGLSKLSSRIKPPWLISTFAVMAAGSANVAFTRSNEMTEGVDVMNDKGEIVGKSKIAGKYAVGYTVLSRSVFLPIPIMVLPGLMSQFMTRTWFKCGVGRVSKLCIDVGCIILSQAVALPVCIAAFPQTLQIKRGQLEPEFKASGFDDEILYVQKGV
jgi:tricarboxylate carrier